MNRNKCLLCTVRGCLITTFCSMHFDGRDADTICREWHINVLDDPDDVLPHQNAAIRWAQIGGLTAWLATLSAF